LTSVGFAVTHQLPVLFVCEDNGLAILTPIKDRRSWNITDVVRGFGINAVDIEDDPLQITSLDIKLPMFLNIRTCRHNWHVGSGQDKIPEQDRLNLYRKDYEGIENEVKGRMEKIWQL
jgi:pyruvate dehydrogenase E1 component alpha subunit